MKILGIAWSGPWKSWKTQAKTDILTGCHPREGGDQICTGLCLAEVQVAICFDNRLNFMFKPLAIYIGFRYTRGKRRNHFISFISLASMLGIALGVMVLITVLSVMNGFDFEIHNRIFGLARQVVISEKDGVLKDFSKLGPKVLTNQKVEAFAPFIDGQAMISNQGVARGVLITGVLPDEERKVSTLPENLVQGSMDNLKEGSFGIVLGADLALNLDLSVGDQVVIITPQSTPSLIGVIPRFKRFTVVGVFHVSEGLGYDATTAFINLKDAQKLLQIGDSVSGLRIKVKSLYDAPLVADQLRAKLSPSYQINDWTETYGAYFKAIQMEKTTMFVVLLFIIAVATFNLISSLVMTVTDKRSDIAILRTLGMSPKMIMGIFMVQGGIIGMVGTFLGVFGGILLALNAPDLVRLLEHYLNVHFISDAIYFINYLPSKLEWLDVIKIGLASLLMSFLATIYPSWQASRVQPAEALRYE
jgi:lipoprotein-releasing system permease protein